MKKDLTPGTIYAAAVAALPAGDIDHHASDLYLKRTPAAVALVGRLDNRPCFPCSVTLTGWHGMNSRFASPRIGRTPENTSKEARQNIMLNTFKSPADVETVRELGREFQELVSISNFSYGELAQMQWEV